MLTGFCEADSRRLRLDRPSLRHFRMHGPVARSPVVRTTTLNCAEGLLPAGMICVVGEVSTENGGTTASGIDHTSPLLSCMGVRATLRITPSSPPMLYTTCADTGGGGSASVRYSGLSIL